MILHIWYRFPQILYHCEMQNIENAFDSITMFTLITGIQK